MGKTWCFIKNRSKSSFLGLLFIVTFLVDLSYVTLSAQDVKDVEYREIFGDDYLFAVEMTDHKSWSDSLLNHGFDPDFALALVFPELIRYSSIRDYIEVKGLEVLYVQYGRDYADFSVGLFQMKPSFAERLESDLLKYHLIDRYPFLYDLNPDTASTARARNDRISRLKDDHFQLLYLEAFLIVMDIYFPGVNTLPDDDKLIFCSTAYNTGYFKGYEKIMEERSKARFYRGLDILGVKYLYSEISLSYFHERKGK